VTIKRNLGRLDRGLRAGVALVMIYFGFFENSIVTDSVATTILSLLGIGGLIVAIFGFCPMYTLAGFSTREDEEQTNNDPR